MAVILTLVNSIDIVSRYQFRFTDEQQWWTKGGSGWL